MSMNMPTHTTFHAEKLQAAVNRRWALRSPDGRTAPTIRDGREFQALVPEMSTAEYDEIAWSVYRASRCPQPNMTTPATQFHVGGSSGTTSKSKLVLSLAPGPHTPPSDEQRSLIRELREGRWFGPGDVAANCFLVGHFSLLHHGFNRILDACGVTTVPVGALDRDHPEAQLRFLHQAGVNTLAGTPGTLIQVAHAVRASGVALDVRTVAFTGERLGPIKESFLRTVFPAARVLGLYGMSECGFVALGGEGAGGYRVREDAYFLETDATGRLLLTTLDPALPVPLLRYAPGDRIALSAGSDGARIGFVERFSREFNFMGNLIDVSLIARVVAEGLGLPEPVMDITLSSDVDGRDSLAVRIFGVSESAADLADVGRLLRSLPELREAIEKNAGGVRVAAAPLAEATLSPRQKHVQLLDERG